MYQQRTCSTIIFLTFKLQLYQWKCDDNRLIILKKEKKLQTRRTYIIAVFVEIKTTI